MAEKLCKFPNTVNLLSTHQIGYHTSSHSVHPALFEFTDIENYRDALKESLLRETSHINPITGAIEGKGGIHVLRELFPHKEIAAFRSPGHCWSPPHLEALKCLGVKYDFSANLSINPVNYKGIVFYPYHMDSGLWSGTFLEYLTMFKSFRNDTSVFTVHPSLIVNKFEWDSIYFKSNPEKMYQPDARSPSEIMSYFQKFELFLRRLCDLQKLNFLEVTPPLKMAKQSFNPTKLETEKSYLKSIRWATNHGYKPKYLKQHFLKFFDQDHLVRSES
jgi:hypothetical protein